MPNHTRVRERLQSAALLQDLLQSVLQRPPCERVGKPAHVSASPQLLQQHVGCAGGVGLGVGLGVGAGLGAGVGEGVGLGVGLGEGDPEAWAMTGAQLSMRQRSAPLLKY